MPHKIEFLDTESDLVRGESFLLETAISNLLQNAIDSSHPGGLIRIEITTQEDDVSLTITDEGTGIPDYALDRVFDRFYSSTRTGQERKSFGLGLYFVRESVALHGGSLTIQNRTGKPGVKATLHFSRVSP